MEDLFHGSCRLSKAKDHHGQAIIQKRCRVDQCVKFNGVQAGPTNSTPKRISVKQLEKGILILIAREKILDKKEQERNAEESNIKQQNHSRYRTNTRDVGQSNGLDKR